jgi:hypothetical protein
MVWVGADRAGQGETVVVDSSSAGGSVVGGAV